MKIIFFGTPDFALPTLKRLIVDREHTVLAVVCQPDRPAGRGQKLHVPATKLLALEHKIPVMQPEKLSKSPETVAALQALQPDLIVMVAFGQILKKDVLALPRSGVLNLHGSLLPAYRGAAPINWAIINGETITGVTTMFTEAGVDTGPMLLRAAVPITLDMTAEDLALHLADIGGELVVETLRQLQAGTLEAEKQDDSQATYAPMLSKEIGRLAWTDSALRLHNLVRGLVPWPGTFTGFRGAVMKICKTSPEIALECKADIERSKNLPGMLVVSGKQVFVKCGSNGEEVLSLLEVQPTGKGKLTANQWANGARLLPDEKFD